MKRLDQGHLNPKLEVSRESNPSLRGARRALQKSAIRTAIRNIYNLNMRARPVENASDKGIKYHTVAVLIVILVPVLFVKKSRKNIPVVSQESAVGFNSVQFSFVLPWNYPGPLLQQGWRQPQLFPSGTICQTASSWAAHVIWNI